ncbi:MAG: T9SS type A sorting domain-containing protein [Bacteroidetes bacterium]|nr:T9SS type A sorting domain-containing protein [Bacteroidota bacterium]
MKSHFLTLSLFFLTIIVSGQTLTWEKTYSRGGKEVASSIKHTSDGGYIVAGCTGINYDTNDMWILKLDVLGDTLWTRIFDFEKADWALSVIQSNDEGYVVSGFTSPTSVSQGTKMKIIKLTETGDTIWTYQYEVEELLANDVIKSVDGGYIVLGCNYSEWPDKIVLLKLNEDGETDWIKTYQGEDYGVIYQMKQTSDTGYIMVGQIYTNPENGYDIFSMKLDRYGDTLWTKTFGTADYEIAFSVEETNNDQYIVAVTQDYGNLIIFYYLDANGNILTDKSYAMEPGSSIYLIEKTSDGGFICSGHGRQLSGENGLFIMKLDETADSVWTRFYQKNAYSDSWAEEIHQTDDGGYIVGGTTSYQFGEFSDMWILKLNEEGILSTQDDIFSVRNLRTYNIPNPFSESTTIIYTLDEPANIQIEIIDHQGQKVTGLVNTFQEKGEHGIHWDARGHKSGIYYYEITIDDRFFSGKMLLIR